MLVTSKTNNFILLSLLQSNLADMPKHPHSPDCSPKDMVHNPGMYNNNQANS